MEAKPLEFKIVEDDENDDCYKIIIFYDDDSQEVIYTHTLPKSFKLNRHYSVTDLYGNTVIDDRKGL